MDFNKCNECKKIISDYINLNGYCKDCFLNLKMTSIINDYWHNNKGDSDA